MLLYAIILLFFGKIQEHIYEENSTAWQWALAFAAVVVVFNIFSSVIGAMVMAVVLGLYAWAYFAALRYVTDNLLLWMAVYVGGALLPLMLLLKWVAALTADA